MLYFFVLKRFVCEYGMYSRIHKAYQYWPVFYHWSVRLAKVVFHVVDEWNIFLGKR